MKRLLRRLILFIPLDDLEALHIFTMPLGPIRILCSSFVLELLYQDYLNTSIIRLRLQIL